MYCPEIDWPFLHYKRLEILFFVYFFDTICTERFYLSEHD